MALVTSDPTTSAKANLQQGAADTSAAEASAASDQPTLRKTCVAVVFTGGTIAISTTKTPGVAPALTGREIMERVPEVKQYLDDLEIEIHDFSALPGPHVSPEIMWTLSDFVTALAERADGVVVTHGTDTLEESAHFLDMTLKTKTTVVFTGSMHPATDAAWDGGRNLIDAFAVAGSSEFRGQGVLVVMDGSVHAANEVRKSHTMRRDTFTSPNFGPLGTVNILASSAPMRNRSVNRRISIGLDDEAELPYVEMLMAYAGMDDRLFVAALKNNAAGIVVEAMGQGNVPPGVINGIARAREMKLPVIITTRCFSGQVRPYYTYEGAGRDLEHLGCIFAPYLTGPKARLTLMLALAAGYDDAQLRAVFSRI